MYIIQLIIDIQNKTQISYTMYILPKCWHVYFILLSLFQIIKRLCRRNVYFTITLMGKIFITALSFH